MATACIQVVNTTPAPMPTPALTDQDKQAARQLLKEEANKRWMNRVNSPYEHICNARLDGEPVLVDNLYDKMRSRGAIFPDLAANLFCKKLEAADYHLR